MIARLESMTYNVTKNIFMQIRNETSAFKKRRNERSNNHITNFGGTTKICPLLLYLHRSEIIQGF